ncbi:5-oxoprolinase subunit PxpB [Chitinophaga sp.]|uniref:5-oxoprolinase subunit PxpB n=1 Tax=Chitinophaga sp. TaxID=1869181 RepID=UPI0031D3257F
MNPDYVIHPLGDSAVILKWQQQISMAIHQEVMKTYYSLRSGTSSYILDLIPAYASLTIVYDAAQLRRHERIPGLQWMTTYIRKQTTTQATVSFPAPRELHIPVCYDPSLGPDITEMAASRHVAIEDIITWHSQTIYTVYLTGFLPGFPYMGEVCPALATPRRQQPRLHVPAGSVGIAGVQTGIYPLDSPGGWNIIGQTPLRMFDAAKADPCHCRPGDRVQFIPVTLEVFRQIQQEQ